jgi:hypothetical protein
MIDPQTYYLFLLTAFVLVVTPGPEARAAPARNKVKNRDTPNHWAV